MRRRILIFVFTFLIIIINASAEGVWKHEFKNETGGNVNSVLVVGYICKNSACKTASSVNPLWDTIYWPSTPYAQPVNSNDEAPAENNKINLIFPVPPIYSSNYGYILRFFAAGYRSKLKPPFETPSTEGWTWPPSDPIEEVVFIKTDNCKSEFTANIQSCAEAGFPISILTDTNLSAETKSAYIPDNDNYYPKTDPILRQWRELNTNMFVDIQDSSGTSVANYPQNDDYPIYADETHNFEFTWQTSKNTPPGDYTIRMVSTVPDDKCDPSTMVPVEQIMTITLSPSPDTCRAEISNFDIENIGLN
jgi:hypothetical protein